MKAASYMYNEKTGELIDKIISPDEGKIAVTIPNSVTQLVGTVECEVGIQKTIPYEHGEAIPPESCVLS